MCASTRIGLFQLSPKELKTEKHEPPTKQAEVFCNGIRYEYQVCQIAVCQVLVDANVETLGLDLCGNFLAVATTSNSHGKKRRTSHLMYCKGVWDNFRRIRSLRPKTHQIYLPLAKHVRFVNHFWDPIYPRILVYETEGIEKTLARSTKGITPTQSQVLVQFVALASDLQSPPNKQCNTALVIL
ncbi:hypothetical protein Pelo_4883 [Pelomyxa schiedti]|nr:hypothetical protein Pelo_4883 [Pelomyxa schiedti]